jgi:MFS family permease
MLLPTMLTWAVNRLDFEQRGRGTGLFVSAVYLGQFAVPLVVAAIALAVGGLQPALAVLAVLALIIAAVTFRTLRRHTEPLNASRL